MTCRTAQRLLSAERDRPLGDSERVDLEAHLAGCGECRQARLVVSEAISHWRNSDAQVVPPDAERAWQDIHRQIRTSTPDRKRGLLALPRWTLPAVAAAALIFAAAVVPRWIDESDPTATTPLEIARAEFVETPKDSSSMVYVDAKSGWLVVWAVNDNDKM
jgi:predicted anti-sigma-YlaC factor YlaD